MENETFARTSSEAIMEWENGCDSRQQAVECVPAEVKTAADLYTRLLDRPLRSSWTNVVSLFHPLLLSGSMHSYHATLSMSL